jgi:tetratricopeptide (TPR) repeat protein
MPSRTYMEIDGRRDHGFRIPRPDLSEPLGTPNACNGCHADRDARWAAAAVEQWRGDASVARHFGEALAAGRDGVSGAGRALDALLRDVSQPAIVRATALSLMAGADGASLESAILEARRESDPLLRRAAARAAEALPPERRPAALRDLLRDPVRSVRIEAARALAAVPERALDPEDRRARVRALDEYLAAQQLDADQPQAHVNLALLHQLRGDLGRAEAAYRRALAVGDYFVPAYVNLADLQRERGRDDLAEPLLLEARRRAPESAEVRQALGLLWVRRERPDDALVELGEAARLAPERAEYAYVHGVALQSLGRPAEALAVWTGALRRHPHHPGLLAALVTTYRDAGRFADALPYARALEAAQPADPALAELRRGIESACQASGQCP